MLKGLYEKWKARIVSLPALAGLLAIAIIYLIVSSFLSQLRLQNSALEQLTYKTDSYSKSLSYFYSQRIRDVTNLSQHTELKTYYENLALGMTPEYGLDASIVNIEEKFNRFIEENTLVLEKDKEPQPIYRSVYLIEKNGHLLAKNHAPDQPANKEEEKFPASLTKNQDEATVDIYRGGADQAFNEYISVPYRFKGEYVGHVIAEITESTFFHRFIENSGYLLALDGLPIGLQQCASCTEAGITTEAFKKYWKEIEKNPNYSEITAPNGNSYLVIHSKIKYSPYELVKLISRHEVLGSVSPWVLLIGMSFLLVLIGIGAVVNIRNSAKRALAEKKVRVLVDNMRQSLFAITKDATIVEPVSRYSEAIFGTNIAGQNLFEVLYKDLQSETTAAITSTLTTVFGEDELQWDLMESHLPKKITMKQKAGGPTDEKTFKIAASPIWDEKQTLSQILFVVEDISALETLAKQVDEQKIQANLLSDIIKNKPHVVLKFLSHMRDFLKQHHIHLEKSDRIEIAPLLNELHTLKGTARLYQMSLLSEQIHNSETKLLELKTENSPTVKKSESLLAEFESIAKVVGAYMNLFDKIYGPLMKDRNDGQVTPLALAKLKEAVEKLSNSLPAEKVHLLQSVIKGLNYKSVAESVRQFEPMVRDLAERLNKKVDFKIEGDALLPAEQLTSLNDCLVHLIQNSLDHGLETPNERRANNKSEVGELTVRILDNDSSVSVQIRDNGRGINVDKLIEIAVKRGFLDDEKKKNLSAEEGLNLIFLPQVSTKSTTTEISGRGIGMDAVKNIIESINGDIQVHSQPSAGSSFEIKLKTAV